MTFDSIKCKGDIDITLDYINGDKQEIHIHNTVLTLGKVALAKSLANEIGTSYDFFISHMIFGDDGTVGGVPKFVDSGRTGLFGITRANKPVLGASDPTIPGTVVFTSVLTYDDANGFTLNEMAIVMNNGDIYSMATFADLSKTSSVQLTFNWRISYI